MPQALTGKLPDARKNKREEAIKRKREPNLGRGIRKASVGLAFLTIVVALLLAGRASPGMGEVWLLLPAFLLLGKGIAEIVTVLNAESPTTPLSGAPPAHPTNALPPQPLHEPLAPPSVTEGTTRHLEGDPQRRRETI